MNMTQSSQKRKPLSLPLARAILEYDKRRESKCAAVERLQYHPAQDLVLSEASRFNVVACGRRWGKTLLGQDLTIETALGGEPVGWFSPTYKDSREVYASVARSLAPLVVSRNKTEGRIEIQGGGLIEFWSLDDPDAGRSRHYRRVVIDEAAKVTNLEYSWNYAIRATLADLHGDAWFLSSTRGRDYFYRIYLRGRDPDQAEYMSWQMPTSSNPYIAKEEIEAARNELPEQAFRQEYLAEFLENSGLVFRNVRACVDTKEYGRESTRYVMGVDWAQSNDFTVLVVMDAYKRRVVDIDRFNQISWAVQRGRLAAMASKWNVSSIMAEYNSIGGPNIEALQADGLPVRGFTTTNDSKQQIIVALQLAFEKQEIAIPDNPVLIGELESFEANRLPSGKWRYEAPTGMHDDTVIALALAYEMSNTPAAVDLYAFA